VSVLAVTIYPLASAYGLVGVCISTLLAHAAMLPLWLLFTRRILGPALQQYTAFLLQPLATTGLLLAPACAALRLCGRREVPMLVAFGIGLAASALFLLARRGLEWKRILLTSSS